jgi:filamentous hemagglutinin family protein
MKKNARQGPIRRTLAAAAVAACFAAPVALANPSGPTVVHGTAAIHQAGNLLQITNSPNAVINWQSFSIGANEITRFLQQSSSSAVLNRVVTQNPSQILGALQSNGRVFLINPNGILFGAGAQVDVAGLVASTLNMSDADFLGGRLRFADGLGKSVVNEGSINTGTGGSVHLIGSGVTNNGIIRSPRGEVILAAGNSVELVSPGTPNLRVEITATDNEARNLGQIISDAGRIGIHAGLINHSGTIRADSAVAEGGRILLKATKSLTLEAGSVTSASGPSGGRISIQSGDTTLVSGSIEATGSEGKGGRIELLGEQVGLINAAEVNASSAAGGGTVLVGGDYQGGNPEVKNSTVTYVGSDVIMKADAVTEGDGGKVIVWADDTTRFGGTISTRGGAQGGDGGFVEVSGKDTLVFRGTVDTRAPRGRTGMLLLDPANIVISNGVGDSANDGDALNNSFSGVPSGAAGTVVGTDNPSAGTLTLFESELEGIAATTSISLAATNNITINNLTDNVLNLAQTAGNSVTFNAGGTFSMTAADTIQTAGGAMSVTANSAILGGVSTAGGAVTINVGAASTAGGVISGAGTSLTKQGAGTLTLSAANTYTGATTVSAGTLALGANNRIANTSTVVVNGGTLDINTRTDTVGGVQLVSGSITGTTGVLTSSSAYDMRSGAVSAILGGGGIALSKSTGGTVTLSRANTYTGLTTVSAGTLRYGANNALATGAVTVADGGTYDLAGFSDSIGALTVNSGVTGGVVTTGAGTLTLTGNIASTGGAANASITGNLAFGATRTVTTTNAADGLNLSAVISGAGGLTKAGLGTVTLSGGNAYAGTTTINAGTLRLAGGSAIADTGVVTLANAATAILDLNGANETIGSLAGGGGLGGNVTLGAGTLSTGGNNASTTYSGVISGTGGLSKQGTGIFTLAGANTYTGATSIATGTLALGAANERISNLSAVTVAAAATFNLATLTETIGSLAGAGTVTKSGAGVDTLTVGGNNTSTTFSGVIQNPAGTLNLTKQGTGTFTLSGANAYTGVTTVSAGTLAAANNTALGTVAGATTVASGATLAISGSGLTIAEPITSLIGTGVGGGGALRNLANNNTWTGTVTLGAGGARINSDAGTLTLSGAGNITGAGQSLTAGGAGNTTISKVIATGAGTLTKDGAGTLTLSGANTYTGLTTVSAGTLRYGVANALLTGAVTVADGGTYDLAGFSDSIGALTVNSGVTGGAVTTGAGTLTLTGNITSTGGAANASISGNLAFAATRTITTTNAVDGLNVSAVISGPGGVTKAGLGTVTLSGASTYSGATAINAGTLLAANAAALGSTAGGTTVSSGATLNINNVVIGNEAISIDGNGVAGAGALTGTGTASLAGTLTLVGASRIGTTSGASTLALDGAANAGGNALDITGAGDLAATNALNNFGTVTVNGTGDVTLVDADALTIGASSVGRLSAQTLSGNLTLGGNITATGSGDTIVLAAAANFDNSGGNSLDPNAGGGGRWLVYSTDPANDNRGGLESLYAFKQYGLSYSGPYGGPGTGNGLIYSVTPNITPNASGSASRGYDGTTIAPAGSLIVAPGAGVIDSDTVTLSFTGATYDTKHVGTNKPVTASGISIATQTNSGRPVYGYTSDPTASANVGEITAAPIAVTAQTDSRGYNGTTTSAVAPVVTGTLYDAVGTAATQSFDTKHVGTGKTLTASGLVVNDGNGGSNYSISYVSANTGQIDPALVTVTVQTDSRGYDGTTASSVAPAVTGTLYDPVGTAATQSFDTKHAGTGKTLTASALVVNDGNGGNNYAITYVTDTTGVITAAALTVTAQTDNRMYNGTTSSSVAPVVTGTLYDAVGTAATQSFDTRNAGTGKTLTASGLAVNDGNGGSNYAITYVADNTGVITTAPLSITADNASRPVNQPNPPFAVTYSGFQTGDTPGALTGTLSYSTPATVGSPAGAYPITPSGQNSNNYAITYVDGTLTVSAAPPSSAAFVNPLIPAVNYWVPDPQVAAPSAPVALAMDESLTPLPPTAAGPVGGSQPTVAASGAPVALAMDESLTPLPPTAAGPVGGSQPTVAASGAPVALAMDESLAPLPPTAASPAGREAAPGDAQAPRRVDGSWACFRYGPVASRRCR